MRPELTPLPYRMQRLPLDERQYPVPFFVAYLDGKPDFRVMDLEKWKRAVSERRCWICGDPLGSYLCFVIGPMCAINRTTSEPPCHRECARWAAINCPFLARPHMDRREAKQLQAAGAESLGGVGLARNPGVTLIWITQSYQIYKPAGGGRLIEVGDPIAWEWWAEGRTATRAEVEESIRTGLPHLEEIASQEE